MDAESLIDGKMVTRERGCTQEVRASQVHSCCSDLMIGMSWIM
jgi:hypothetical protein